MFNWKAFVACAAAVAIAVFLVLQTASLRGDDRKQSSNKDAAAKKPTHTIEKKPFRIELSLQGTLEPEQTTGIAFHPQPANPPAPGPLTIRKIVPHGTSVKKGDELVVFDTRRLSQMIAQLEAELKVLDASTELAQVELPSLEKSIPLELDAAELGKREADEDLDYFLKTARPDAEKRAHQQVKFAAFGVEFAQEQLRQLEKMYKANDLTEDTEKIILKRQRMFVDFEIEYLKYAEMQRDQVLKTTLPRREKSLRDGAARHALQLERTRSTLTPGLAHKQQTIVKMRFERDKLRSNLDMLRKDKGAMTMTAPVEGLVYYGKFTPGHWEATSALAARLVPEGNVTPDEVFLTIVQPRPLSVRLHVDEKEVHLLRTGLSGKAHPTFDPDRKLPATVIRVATVPALPGKFEATVSVQAGADAIPLMPGMSCTIKFVPYAKKDALAVPVAAVFEEDDKHFVHVVDGDGKESQRQVSAGRTFGGRTEILSGVSAGDKVLLERPGDSKSTTAAGGE